MSFEDRLREQLHRAATTIPVTGLDFEETLGRGRRARRLSMALAAGAAAIAIGLAVAGSSQLLNWGAERVPPAGGGSASPSVTTTPPTEQEIVSVVRSWLQAIERGDEDAAWELMTPEAQAEVGRAKFDQMMGSALPEGFGAFADPDVAVSITEVEVAEGSPALVATLAGTIPREGSTEFATQAIPLRVQDGTALIDERFVPRQDVATVWTSSSLGPMPVREGKKLSIEEVEQPGEVAGVFLSIDGASPALRARFDAQSGTAVVTADRTLKAGRHVATIAVVDNDGRMFTEARVFETAAP